MNGTGQNHDGARVRKVARARRALVGFVSCLACGATGLALQAPLMGLETALGQSFPLLSSLLYRFMGLALAGVLVCIGILISALVMDPREEDIRPDLESSLPLLVRIMVYGMAAFLTLVLVTVIVIMVFLYAASHNPLFGAIAFLCAAIMIFAGAVGFTLVRTIGSAGGPSIAERIASTVHRDRGDGVKAGRFLGALEWALCMALAAGVSVVIGWDDLISLLRPYIGGARADAAERVLTTGDAVLYLFSLVIVLFAAAFTVKGLRIFIETTRNTARE